MMTFRKKHPELKDRVRREGGVGGVGERGGVGKKEMR